MPEINDLWVIEEYRGKGIGIWLIKMCEDLAKGMNYSQIRIGVGMYRDYGPVRKLYYPKNHLLCRWSQ